MDTLCGVTQVRESLGLGVCLGGFVFVSFCRFVTLEVHLPLHLPLRLVFLEVHDSVLWFVLCRAFTVLILFLLGSCASFA